MVLAVSVLVFLLLSCELARGVPILDNYKLVPNSVENLAIIANSNYQQNLEELSGQFEGDLVLSEQQIHAIQNRVRNGLKDITGRWSNNIIPYNFTNEFSLEDRSEVQNAMRSIEAAASCLTFVQRTTEEDFIEINVGGLDLIFVYDPTYDITRKFTHRI